MRATADPPPTSRTATAGGFAAILLWSATVALARSLSERVGPLPAAAAVYTVAAVLLLAPWLARPAARRRTFALPRRYRWVCGALFVTYTALLYLAIGRAPGRPQVLAVGLLNYLWPALTVVLSVPLLGRRARGGLWPATLLALAGLWLVLTAGAGISVASFVRTLAEDPLAYGAALAAALAWALYSNLTTRWAGGETSGAVPLFLAATCLVTAGAAALAGEPGAWTVRGVAEAGALGVATGLGYALWDLAMRRGRTGLVVAASYLTPALSTVASCVYLAVEPPSVLWLGCAALIGGSALSWRAIAPR